MKGLQRQLYHPPCVNRLQQTATGCNRLQHTLMVYTRNEGPPKTTIPSIMCIVDMVVQANSKNQIAYLYVFQWVVGWGLKIGVLGGSARYYCDGSGGKRQSQMVY